MKTSFIAAALAISALAPVVANAQETTPGADYVPSKNNVPAPNKAFELSVGSGYTQGFGLLERGVGLPSVAQAGVGIEASAGYRFDPRWGITFGGQYQEFDAQRSADARGITGTVAVQYHAAPTARLDPWLELGTGYRSLWENRANTPNVVTHGLELGRARVGVDIRVSQDLALAPVIGADATMFLWQDTGSTSAISNPSVSTFLFGGLQGRLDLGGSRVSTTSTARASRTRTAKRE